MIQLLVGAKGSGKTKTLIDLANKAAELSNGSVVCIEKGDKLIHDITYKARLINTDLFGINCAESLFGFLCGILASNSDITDICVDGSLKICDGDVAGYEKMLTKLEPIVANIHLVMTVSMPIETASEIIRAHIL